MFNATHTSAHALRYSLFYVAIFILLSIFLFFVLNFRLYEDLIKYFIRSNVQLSQFNSVFELCVAFNLAYTAIIKFRSAIKEKAFLKIKGKLEASQKKSLIDFLKIGTETPFTKYITNNITYFITDIDRRLRKENKLSTDDNFHHRSENAFIYFSFYSLLCIVMGGLEDGLSSPEFVFHSTIFLFTFTLISLIIVTLMYVYVDESSFSGIVIIFTLNFLVCFAISKYMEVKYAKCIIEMVPSLRVVLGKNELHSFTNYCRIIFVITNIFPYILFFQKLYVVFFRYTCAIYQFDLISTTYIKFISLTFTFHPINAAKKRLANYLRKILDKLEK